MSKNYGTQKQRIHDALKRGETLTWMSAWQNYGVARLAAIVGFLEKPTDTEIAKNVKAVSIIRKKLEVKNRYGETCKVQSYRLPDDHVEKKNEDDRQASFA